MASNEYISSLVLSQLNYIIQTGQSNILLDIPFISEKLFQKLSKTCQILDISSDFVFLPEDNKKTTIIKNLHLIKFKRKRLYALESLRKKFKEKNLLFISPLTESNLLRIQTKDLSLNIVKVKMDFSQYESEFAEQFLLSIKNKETFTKEANFIKQNISVIVRFSCFEIHQICFLFALREILADAMMQGHKLSNIIITKLCKIFKCDFDIIQNNLSNYCSINICKKKLFFTVSEQNLKKLDRRMICFSTIINYPKKYEDFQLTGFLYNFHPRVFFLSQLSEVILDTDKEIYSCDEMNGCETFLQQSYKISSKYIQSLKKSSLPIMESFKDVRNQIIKQEFILQDDELHKCQIAINRKCHYWKELHTEQKRWRTINSDLKSVLKKYVTGGTGRGCRNTQLWTDLNISTAIKVAQKHMDTGTVDNYR